MNKTKLTIMAFLISGVVLSGCSSGSDQSSASAEKVQEPTQTEEVKELTSDEKAEKFYFTADEGGSITKISASTNEVVETIEVDGVVHNVQVSPDGKMLGATVIPFNTGEAGHETETHRNDSHGDHGEDPHGEAATENDGHGHGDGTPGQAMFFNIKTNELIESVPVGNHPAHFVFTEDGKYALVTNNEDDNVSVIDMKSMHVTAAIATGKGPHGFRISSDSKKAYIANMNEDSVSVIDLVTMKEEKKITVGTAPVTTGITSDGKTLVVTLNAENSLAIVDLETDQIEKVEVGHGPAQVYIDGNDQFAYVANQGTADAPSASVTVIDLAAKKAAATIPTGKGAHGAVTSSDSKFLYVTNMFDHTVTVIDTEEQKAIETIEVGKVPNGISIMK